MSYRNNGGHEQPPASIEPPIPYPDNPVMKWAYKSPILFYRLGLGPLVGRLFMVLTTTGRTSGLPRRTAIEFHTWRGRTYVLSAWGERAQWYRNLQADPRVTIQTARGVEHMVARRVTDPDELAEAFEMVEQVPAFRAWFGLMGLEVSRAAFLVERERFHLVTFDPTDAPTPPPLPADLVWTWGALGVLLALGWLFRRR
jgi:deazaflavin-dependent oxidoreductase (nitroreductase family)